MNIQYYTKSIYGTDTLYILDDSLSSAIALISGKKTLTSQVKTGLEKIGFTFEEVLQPKN